MRVEGVELSVEVGVEEGAHRQGSCWCQWY